MESWDRLSALPLHVESYEFERRAATFAYGFERVTTLIRLRGDGAEGLGEDVSPYEGEDDTLHVAAPELPLTGEWTLGAFCDQLTGARAVAGGAALGGGGALAQLGLRVRRARPGTQPGGPPATRRRRPRAAPAALRQLARPRRPAAFDPIRRRLEAHPDLRFKLDVTPAWTTELIDEVAATGAVEIVDFKGHYGLETGELPALLAMYERAIAAFPDALLEDAHDLPEVTRLLEPECAPHLLRRPIHTKADLDATPLTPRAVNIKPCRVGDLRSLLDVYAAVEERGLITYGGGMGELDVGRGQIQLLASLFHPDGPNDTAPSGYNHDTPAADLPTQPARGGPGGDRLPPGVSRRGP